MQVPLINCLAVCLLSALQVTKYCRGVYMQTFEQIKNGLTVIIFVLVFVLCRYLSWFYYSFQLLMMNQWHEVDYLGCPEYGIPDGTTNGGLWGPVNDTKSEKCLYKDGKEFNRSMYIFAQDQGLFWGLLCVLLISYRAIAFSILFYKVRDSTR